MNTILRKKSPRAPSISLDDAIEKAGKIYDKDRCHAAPIDGVAQHIGYKNAGNGAALSALASLKYYGLIDRPKEGMAAVSKQYEAFRFAPSETIKHELITKWLKAPPVFAELLGKYTEGLPSDKTLIFDLIQNGFAPGPAESCVQIFRKSVDFAHYFDCVEESFIEEPEAVMTEAPESTLTPSVVAQSSPEVQIASTGVQVTTTTSAIQPTSQVSETVDRIPIRLAGGRRAWIEIPTPFYGADKERLKKQIDLLITDDEENPDE